MRKQILNIKSEYSAWVLILDEKGTSVYMEIPGETGILCKSWQGKRPDLAFNYIAKQAIL